MSDETPTLDYETRNPRPPSRWLRRIVIGLGAATILAMVAHIAVSFWITRTLSPHPDETPLLAPR